MTAPATALVGLAYLWRHRRWPAIARPLRFTEWVQWRKLYDRDLGLARLTDKSWSKRVAAAALGEAMVIPTWWDGIDLPADPPWPMPFIVKANHGCDQYVVVRSLPDYQRARRLAPAWLARAYGGWLGEWHYRAARRSLLVEPYLGPTDSLPLDYKVYVFGGRAAMIQLHEGRGAAHRWSHYDLGWRALSAAASRAPPPASLDAIIAAAERLGEHHDFLRIDFYEIDGKPRFGEFCLYPGSGLDPFDPVDLDHWLGDLWSSVRRVERRARHVPGMAARVTSAEAAPA